MLLFKPMAKQKRPETMEELTNSILHACELTQNLESHLPNLANDPATLFLSIDEIVNTLSAAKEKLLVFQQGQTPASSFAQMIPLDMKQHQMVATPMQDYAQKIDQLPQMQQLQAAAPYDVGAHFLQRKMMGSVDFTQLRSRGTLQIGNMGGRDVEERSKGSEGEVQAIEAPPPRLRRSKKVELEKITKMVPAPEFGNTELPPDHDGFSWRKYGSKEILGSKYPRSYYRCTHQKLYECLAKKQVQRVDSNPRMFQVTYRGNHTCHMSSTAPSSSAPLPPPPQQLLVDMSQDMTIQSSISTQLSPSSASASGSLWLPTMNLSLQVGGGGMAPAAADACSGSAGASTSSRYGGDYAVVDLADVMFNSGNSSGNSMESLFPPPSDE